MDQDRLKNLENIDDIKRKLSTSSKERVTNIFAKYKELGETSERRIFRVLNNIRKKNQEHIELGQLSSYPKNDNLLSIISNKYILLAAYRSIRKNKGTMTPASFIPMKEYNQLSEEEKDFFIRLYDAPDMIDMNFIMKISYLIKHNIYPWGVSRLIWIPKPGTNKERPITMPPFSDKMIQEAIRMVLEAIYEPEMQNLNCSFGFRASNSTHHAIVTLTEMRHTAGLNKALEGDFESAYPNLDRDILINVLSEKISDNKFLRFIRKRLHLRLFDTKSKKYEQTFLGIPQGGIDSPYLWNIYLIGLDKFVKNDIQLWIDSLNVNRLKSKGRGKNNILLVNPINPLYNHIGKELIAITDNIDKEKELLKTSTNPKNYENLFKLMSKKRLTRHLKLNIRSTDPNRTKIKLVYVRYADDWIIFTNAPNDVLIEMKKRITDWSLINRKAILSQEKTLITDMRKTYAHFLGFQFKNTNTRRIGKDKLGQLKRTTGWGITCSPDQQRLINRYFMKRYCDKNGFPREIPWLATLDAFTIVQKYNSVIEGITNYYADYVTYPSSLNRWIYILKWSCYKTLAQKFKTNCSGIFNKFGKQVTIQTTCLVAQQRTYMKEVTLYDEKDIVKKVLSQKQKISISQELLQIEKGLFIFYDNIKKQRTPRIYDSDFLEKISWVNFRTEASFDLPCVNCGSIKNRGMHHINQIRKTKFSSIAPEDSITRMMFLRGRRQIPFCWDCHMNKIHSGNYVGTKINQKLYDNRIINSENFIQIGTYNYVNLPLEENMVKNCGWKLINTKK
jgi:hypothetical protein